MAPDQHSTALPDSPSASVQAQAQAQEHRATPQGRKLLAVTLLVPVVVAAALTLFAWPASELAPRDLPIGVAGPEQATGGIARQLQGADETAFEVHRYADEAAARSAIRDREVYAAVVAGPRGLTLLTATAASPQVAQLLTQGITAQAQHLGVSPQVVDVVPTTAEDPRGVVLGSALLPLVLAGLLAGILVARVSRAGLGQVVSVLVASTLTGLVAVGIAQGWLGALAGDWWVNASVVGLTVCAISLTVAGFGSLLGAAGLGLGAVLMMLVGNPFSGVTSAPELLPRWAGVTGQLLPPGAGGNLLRSTAYFDGAAALAPLLVLCGWVAVGLVAVLLGSLRRRT